MLIAVTKEIKSLNYWNSKHWSARHAESQDWEKHIVVALIGKIHRHKATGRRKVTVTSIRKRALDMSNLSGGFKGGLDAIKRLGLIVDDSPRWIEEVYVQKIQKSGTGTIIELEEL